NRLEAEGPREYTKMSIADMLSLDDEENKDDDGGGAQGTGEGSVGRSSVCPDSPTAAAAQEGNANPPTLEKQNTEDPDAVDAVPAAAAGDGIPAVPAHETFFGFIKEPIDALLVVEACIRGLLVSVDKVPSESAAIGPIRSGSIVVFEESSKRWRDGRRWSPSRVHGPFLLYREVEATTDGPDPRKCKPTHILDTRIPGLEPTYSFKTLKQNTRLVPDGLTKRTITLKASDGLKHRIISYYAREDVIHMYTPATSLPSESGIGDQPDGVNRRVPPPFVTPSETEKLKVLLEDASIDWKGLLAESIDMEKYASEEVLAKKQRREETIKAVARHAFGKDSDDEDVTPSSASKRRKVVTAAATKDVESPQHAKSTNTSLPPISMIAPPYQLPASVPELSRPDAASQPFYRPHPGFVPPNYTIPQYHHTHHQHIPPYPYTPAGPVYYTLHPQYYYQPIPIPYAPQPSYVPAPPSTMPASSPVQTNPIPQPPIDSDQPDQPEPEPQQ
ncbi:Gti1/Pac2 family-domain-containing protein, partial [Obelidium mucronatum]